MTEKEALAALHLAEKRILDARKVPDRAEEDAAQAAYFVAQRAYYDASPSWRKHIDGMARRERNHDED